VKKCAKVCSENLCNSDEDCPTSQSCGDDKRCKPKSEDSSTTVLWLPTFLGAVGAVLIIVLSVALCYYCFVKIRARRLRGYQQTQSTITEHQQQHQPAGQPAELFDLSPPPPSNPQALEQLPAPSAPPPSYADSVVEQ
jgi:hypothetical protein